MYLDEKNVWNGEMPGDLRAVVHRLSKKEIPCYVVGPAVRDALLSGTMERTQRIDLLALGGNIQKVEKVLDSSSASNFFIGHPERLRRATSAFNVQASQDGEILRKLVISAVADERELRDEMEKREVTVNAVALSGTGTVYDPFGGLPDLEAQRVRPVIPPSQAFVQKPLFLVKVAKHVAFHGYEADSETEEMALRYATNILDVQPERIRPELERLLVNLFPDRGLDFLQRTGLLPLLLPEVQNLVGFSESCEVHHKDIWEHTKKVVARSKPTPAIRWAALLHDIGKVWTRSIDSEGRVHFFRHEDLGAIFFGGIATRLALDDRLVDRVRFLIRNHSRINMYATDWTDSAVRRLVRETGEYFEELLALSRADITSRQERRVEELNRLLDELGRRVEEIRTEDSKKPVLPKGAGAIIMQHFGIPAGPLVGHLKDLLEQAIQDGRQPPDRPVEEYLGFLQELIRKAGE